MFILEMRIAQVPIDFAVEKIYAELQDDFPTMSLATVCRNVILLESLGEVLELGFPDGSNRYDGNKPYPHPYLYLLVNKKKYIRLCAVEKEFI